VSHFSFFFSSRRRHTRSKRDWSSDVCSSDLSFERYPAFPRAAHIGSNEPPPGYPSAGLHLCRARFRFTWSRCSAGLADHFSTRRSEERRVGKECRCPWLTASSNEKI